MWVGGLYDVSLLLLNDKQKINITVIFLFIT